MPTAQGTGIWGRGCGTLNDNGDVKSVLHTFDLPFQFFNSIICLKCTIDLKYTLILNFEKVK